MVILISIKNYYFFLLYFCRKIRKNDKINNLFQQTHDNIFPLMNMNLDPSLEHKPILGTPFNSLSFMRNNNPLGPAETSS